MFFLFLNKYDKARSVIDAQIRMRMKLIFGRICTCFNNFLLIGKTIKKINLVLFIYLSVVLVSFLVDDLSTKTFCIQIHALYDIH